MLFLFKHPGGRHYRLGKRNLLFQCRRLIKKYKYKVGAGSLLVVRFFIIFCKHLKLTEKLEKAVPARHLAARLHLFTLFASAEI